MSIHFGTFSSYLRRTTYGIEAGEILAFDLDHIRVANSIEGAIMLGRLIFLDSIAVKEAGNGIPISAKEWQESTGLKSKTIRNLSKKFAEMGFLKTCCKKTSVGTPTTHYLFSIDLFKDYLEQIEVES